VELKVTIFQRRRARDLEWYTVGLSKASQAFRGATESKVRSRVAESLRRHVAKLGPEALEPLELVPGRKLEVVTIELPAAASRRKIRAKFPVIIEPRERGPACDEGAFTIVFHPLRQSEWFVHEEQRALEDEAAIWFRERWAELDEEAIEELQSHGSDRLRFVSLSATHKSLESRLDEKKEDPRTLLGAQPRAKGEALLAQLGTNETLRAVDDRLEPGIVRMPYRGQLEQLVCGRRRASVVLVGPPSVGKSTLVRRLVHDMLAADGYSVHRNLDKVHAVWRVSGRRLIAGMSYLGQWEQRCVDLLEACREHRVVLWVEDLASWGRIGETRESERSLATFFRGPIARGELPIVAECTAEQYQQLQIDAPGLASALTTLFVEPTDEAETMRMLVHEARDLEVRHAVAFDPSALRTIHELGGAIAGGAAFPGVALDLLRSLVAEDTSHEELARAEQAARRGRKIDAIKIYREITGDRLATSKRMVEGFMASGRWPSRDEPAGMPKAAIRSALARDFGYDPERRTIGAREVVRALARRTGMPEVLLAPDRSLHADEVDAHLGAHVMGQPAAVAAVRDLVLRLAAGLADRGRPYGVLLFTGPTGTGKTEMAKCLAEYLYGDIGRLVRLDMSEYAGPGAVARLIGDRWQPQGQLTAAVAAQPFCVVLLDEIEKADPSVLNLMLQVFDDGRLTDATGTVIDFSHTVLVMTSNLGAKTAPSIGFGETTSPTAAELEAAVRDFFPPELFNRIDRIVPFSALDDAAAHSIARRELSRLLSRRGLTERDVFVRFTESVVEEIVAKGFAAADGARSLKRWLEDHVGAWLADEIAAQGAAAMRVFWLFRRDGRLGLHGQALREADAHESGSPLEPMLGWNAETLRAQVPTALAEVERVLASPQLERLGAALRGRVSEAVAGDAASAAAAHHLEVLRERLTTVAERLHDQLEYDPLLAHADGDLRLQGEGELAEAESFAFVRRTQPTSRSEVRLRVIDRRFISPSLPLQNRPAFIDALAEVHFLRLALATADDPNAHAVLVELTRLTRPVRAPRFDAEGPGLLEWLARAYVGARGELDALAVVGEDGAVTQPSIGQLDTMLARGNHQVVMRILGPAVRTFFEAEHGCHVRHGLADGREIVRVRVLPGLDVSPRTHVDARADARRAFVHALEHGGEAPVDPDGVSTIVRRYDFDPPAPGRIAPIVVEDYPLSFALATKARTLADVLPSLWLLAIGSALVRAGEPSAPGEPVSEPS
jgi:ATP-dependent Clp protease ATP-binding subunit ClpC